MVFKAFSIKAHLTFQIVPEYLKLLSKIIFQTTCTYIKKKIDISAYETSRQNTMQPFFFLNHIYAEHLWCWAEVTPQQVINHH